MTEMFSSPDLEQFARELLDVAGGSEDSSEQDFTDLLGAMPSCSPWDALPMALDDAVLAKAAQEAAADLVAESRPPASACGEPAAAPATAEPHDAFDWLLPFIDSPSTDEVASHGQQQPADSAAAAAVSDTKLAMARERSRRWQQRYRAKQRQKLKDSTTHVQELTRELETLRSQQAESRRREALFERFVASQGRSQRPEGSHNLTTSSAESTSRASLGDQEAAVVPATWEDLKTRLWTTTDIAQLAYRGKTSAEFWEEVLTFTICGDEPVAMTREQISQLSAAEYGRMWKAIVNEIAGCFLAVSEDSKSEASQRVRKLVNEGRELKKTLQFLRPNTLLEYSKQLAAQHGPPTAELWRSIAQTVTLSPEQRRRCALLRTAAYTCLGALMRRRAHLAQSMTEVPNLQDAEVTGQLDTDYLGAGPMAERMQAMLRDENSLAAQLQGCLYGNILTALQCCHCHVLAYPFEANPLALLDAFVASSGLPATPPGELIRQGAEAENEKQLPSLFKAAPPLTIAVAGGSLTVEGNVTW